MNDHQPEQETQPLLFALAEAPTGFAALDPREQKFLLGYLDHGNAAKAARSAGYAPKSSKQIGAELLTRHDLLSVRHQISYKLGCSIENKIIRQQQLATSMAGIALDEKRPVAERIQAARAAATSDALIAGLRGQLKLRMAPQADNPTGTVETVADFTPQKIAQLRYEWQLLNPRQEAHAA